MPPDELGRTHGYIRGWLKTGADGKYAIHTVRPGTYPTNDEPAHIHVTIKEPNVPEYYIDDFVFDDDPLLTSEKRLKLENRCGSGLLRLVKKDDLYVGERDLFLGRNIPNHPNPPADKVRSGRNIGEDVVSFIPYHAWGPDKGSRACPVCKYGWFHGILYFVGKDADWTEIKTWLAFFERESIKRGDKLKVYFVYGSDADFSIAGREQQLEAIGRELNLEHVALTFVPSFTDRDSDIVLNKIDPGVESTFILYRRSRIIDKSIDLRPTEEAFRWITTRLDQTQNEYFDIPKGGR
jgi:protocatechuate 3,4-dioxygenase beta subunit